MKKRGALFEGMRLGRLSLGPNDVLVVNSKFPIDVETAERLKEHFENLPLPFKNKVVVLGEGLTLSTIKKGARKGPRR